MMTAALVSNWETRRVRTDGAEIHVRLGGREDGPPLLLLHGFPQTGAMWSPVAERLGAVHRLIVPDLRGYGESVRTALDDAVVSMSKRVMAQDAVAVMAALGHERFAIAGHDRGARVGYRLALDAPDRVTRLALLDILPTVFYWRGMADRAFARAIHHWTFLAQPAPYPETMIAAAPDAFIDATLAAMAGDGGLGAFDDDALAQYRRNAAQDETRRGLCDDYRAGATVDVDHDLADEAAGRRIAAPTLVLWGVSGLAGRTADPLAVWSDWCARVEGRALPCGHFLPEEAPGETARALAEWFAP